MDASPGGSVRAARARGRTNSSSGATQRLPPLSKRKRLYGGHCGPAGRKMKRPDLQKLRMSGKTKINNNKQE